MKKKYPVNSIIRESTLIVFLFLFSSLTVSAKGIHILKNDNGFLILDGGYPVIQFQRSLNKQVPELARNNYFHPLFDLSGNMVTEDFPEDHPHHRGIFWSWHQVIANGIPECDPWMLQNFRQTIDDVEYITFASGAGQISYRSVWHTVSDPAIELVAEQTMVTVSPVHNGIRRIDFKIGLQSLVPGLKIGGSNDDKGYGGFSVRMKTDSSTCFYSNNKAVIPERTAIEAHRHMTVVNKKLNQGITIVSRTINKTAKTARWILRQQNIMQNCVWPGQTPILLPFDKPVWLEYSLLVHDENYKSRSLRKLIRQLEK
jgi:hypothetical protein